MNKKTKQAWAEFNDTLKLYEEQGLLGLKKIPFVPVIMKNCIICDDFVVYIILRGQEIAVVCSLKCHNELNKKRMEKLRRNYDK